MSEKPLEAYGIKQFISQESLGGMLVPAISYVGVNVSHPTNLRGWGVPMATDIAFALGLLAMLGKRVPLTLKVF